MSTFVLVQSAWLGAWAWKPVTEILERGGHRAVAVELPGHGKDKTLPAEVTMTSYVRTVTDALDACPEPAVLVGHSLAGIVISQAAERRPERIASLVYLCAFLLPNGGSFMKATESVRGSAVLDNLIMAEDGSSVTVRAEMMHEAFAHDVPDEGFAQAATLVVPEPVAPLSEPLSITEAGWGRIPRYYVECRGDRAIPLDVQRAMYAAIPVRKVFSLDASHAPNFSQPEELASCLIEVAGQ